MKKLAIKNNKPLHLGFLLVALCALTSFNPMNLYSHLAYLEQGTLDLAASTPEPELDLAAADAAKVAAEAAAAAGASTLDSDYTSSGDTYNVKSSATGLAYDVDGNKLKITKIEKVANGTSSKTQITYEIIPSEALTTQASTCSDCRALIAEQRVVTLDKSFEDFKKDVNGQNAAIQNLLAASFKEVSDQLITLQEEAADVVCADLDYREGKKCFEQQFELAEDCSRSSRRSSRSSRSSKVSDRIAKCENAPDLEDVVEEFKDWASSLATEEDGISANKIRRLKDVSRNREVAKFIDHLLKFKTNHEQWMTYNRTFKREMNALRAEIEDIDNQIRQNPQMRQQLAIRRKQLVVDAEAGAQKYQRSFNAAFTEESQEDILDASAMVDDLRTDYRDIVSVYDGIFTQQRLLDLSDSALASTDSARAAQQDISGLTQARQSRGYIEGFDYDSLRQSFTYQGDMNQNGQRNYNAADPYMTQYQPRNGQIPPQRMSQGGRNWNQWRGGPQQPPMMQPQPWQQRQQPGQPWAFNQRPPMQPQPWQQPPPRY